jgi:hypothetical protein
MGHGRAELFTVIRQVRNRWRRRLAARGALIVLAGTVLALLLSAHGLETLRFTPPAIIGFRLVAAAVFGALIFYGLVLPLRRRVSDSQVALYLEESNPSLEAAILSAIEATSADPATASHSPRLVERLVEQAVEQVRAIDHRRSSDHRVFQRHVVAIGTIATIAALLIGLGPAYLRHGLSALLVIARSAEASTPYRIDVEPGHAKVPRGGDQSVKARLVGFTSKNVSLMMHTASGAPFERVALVPTSDPAAFEGMLFHLDKQTEYYVESNGVRSSMFTVSVVDLPTVSTLDLEYRFPAYTNLPPRQILGGGDVAALKGTVVRLHVTPTMKTEGGTIVLKDGKTSPLQAQADGSLTGSFTISQSGFYRIQLIGPHGEQVDASPQYTIDALDDQPPTVSFSKPGRDTSASPVEEVFTEVKAIDDFGIKSVQLFYSVNGGPQKTVSLFGGSKTLPEVSAGHTIYLEELGLKPGDFVSYYAKATDNDTVPGPQTTSSDIYFVQIRPFKKDYKPAQSQAQSGGGGGGQGDVGDLSRQQREIVAATFNTVRDKAKTKADKYRENVVFLNLAQAKLRAQVEELLEKINSRLGAINNDTFRAIAEALPKAASEMKAAEADLKAMKPDEALTPEQKALKLLQDAEQRYELQVQQQNGGGGGGQQTAMADDLADLFELELDKLANQYEMQKRADQQAGDRQIDQLAEKLKELARRQQQEAERQRRLAQAGQSQQSQGGSGGQRSLAEEAQEAARRLEQLAREQQRPDLAEAARQLQQAADAMRQAAANGSKDGGAQASAALEKLREAERRLDQNQSGRSDRDIQAAERQAQELAEEQKQIASEVRGLDQAGASRQARADALAERKTAMDGKVGDLQKQLEKLANDTRRDQRDASRKLDEAAGSVRDQKIREKIRYSKGALQGMQGGPSQYALAMEDSISSNLDGLHKKVAEAAAAMGQQNKQDALSRAAEQARDLLRGMESLDQRLRDRAASGERDNKDSRQAQNGGATPQRGQQQPGQGADQGQQQSPDGRQSQPQSQQAQGQGRQGQQPGQGDQQAQNGQRGQGQGQGSFGSNRTAGEATRAPLGEGDAGPGVSRFSNDDLRQFSREYQELTRSAQELRQRLQAAGVNPTEFDPILRDLQGINANGAFNDPKALQLLQADALDRLKKLEFNLRRQMGDANNSLGLSGSDEVPSSFRQAIEEYYRLLAKKQTK